MQIVFSHWLDSEGDKIIRKARILELAKNIGLLQLEINGISAQLNMTQGHATHASSRLSALVKYVKYFPLYDAVLRTIQEMTEYLLPILHLYYPTGKSFLGNEKIRMDFIKEGDNFTLETMANQVKRLSNQVVVALNTKTLSEETGKYIVLRIPRPGSNLSDSEKKLVPLLSEERAKILWDHLFSKEFDPSSWGLKIQFGDLYQQTRLSALGRTEENPIILDMALLFGLDDFGTAGHLQEKLETGTLDMHVDREQNYPLLGGPKKLVLTNEALQKHHIRLGFVCSQNFVAEAVKLIESRISTNLNTAKGLSPFMAYRFGVDNRVPLDSIRDDFGVAEDDAYPKQIKDVFLTMKVVSTIQGKSMDWIQSQ